MKCLHRDDDDEKICTDIFVSPTPLFWAVSLVGAGGNVVNTVVFSHLAMRGSPVNSLFWWLSFSELLELITLGFLKVLSSNCSYLDLSVFLHSDSVLKEETLFNFVLSWFFVYLLIVIHSCTVLLNITLVYSRYAAVRHPFQNRSEDWDLHSVKRTAISIYVFSFITFSPFLLGAYAYKLSVDYTHQKASYEDIAQPVKIFSDILLFVSIVQVVSFITLTIASCMLIFAVIRARRSRPRSLVPNTESAGTERSMRKINNLVIIILVMFFISDISMTLKGFGAFLTIRTVILDRIDVGKDEFRSTFIYIVMTISVELTSCLQWFFILVNCSYSTFCYLIFSSAYRNTVKVMVKDWYDMVRLRIGGSSGSMDELREERS